MLCDIVGRFTACGTLPRSKGAAGQLGIRELLLCTCKLYRYDAVGAVTSLSHLNT